MKTFTSLAGMGDYILQPGDRVAFTPEWLYERSGHKNTLRRINHGGYVGNDGGILDFLKIPSKQTRGWILHCLNNYYGSLSGSDLDQDMPSSSDPRAPTFLCRFIFRCLHIRAKNPEYWQNLSAVFSSVLTDDTTPLKEAVKSVINYNFTNSPISKQQNNETSNQTIIVPAKAAVITRGQEFSGIDLQGRGGQPAVKVGHLSYRAISNGVYHGS